MIKLLDGYRKHVLETSAIRKSIETYIMLEMRYVCQVLGAMKLETQYLAGSQCIDVMSFK